MRFINADCEAQLDWLALTDFLVACHQLPPAKVADTFLTRGDQTLLTRSAWVEGLGMAVKPATIFPANPSNHLPMVNGAVTLFDDLTGQLVAIIDFHLLTKWKTAGDSLLAARRLARPDCQRALIVGAGNVAQSMIEAYRAAFPDIEVTIWSRTHANAVELARQCHAVAVDDLKRAVQQADLIATTTTTREPIIHGEWLSPGTHLDLIGAYRADTREVDDLALSRAHLFVDNRRTTIGHIGEIQNPLERGVITEDDIIADFYDIQHGSFCRKTEDDITIAKNGGGAHLDLMTATYIMEATGQHAAAGPVTSGANS